MTFSRADYMRSGKALESVQESAASNPGFRHATTIIVGILAGIFIVAVLGMGLLVRALLNRDAKPRA